MYYHDNRHHQLLTSQTTICLFSGKLRSGTNPGYDESVTNPAASFINRLLYLLSPCLLPAIFNKIMAIVVGRKTDVGTALNRTLAGNSNGNPSAAQRMMTMAMHEA